MYHCARPPRRWLADGMLMGPRPSLFGERCGLWHSPVRVCHGILPEIGWYSSLEGRLCGLLQRTALLFSVKDQVNLTRLLSIAARIRFLIVMLMNSGQLLAVLPLKNARLTIRFFECCERDALGRAAGRNSSNQVWLGIVSF